MEEGKLAKWLKKVGDNVKSGDVIAEIETDKATMEVEAIDEGTRRIDRQLTFDPERHEVRIVSGGTSIVLPVRVGARDPISAFFYLRTLPLTEGARYGVPAGPRLHAVVSGSLACIGEHPGHRRCISVYESVIARRFGSGPEAHAASSCGANHSAHVGCENRVGPAEAPVFICRSTGEDRAGYSGGGSHHGRLRPLWRHCIRQFADPRGIGGSRKPARLTLPWRARTCYQPD
jgi:hypothetical protein